MQHGGVGRTCEASSHHRPIVTACGSCKLQMMLRVRACLLSKLSGGIAKAPKGLCTFWGFIGWGTLLLQWNGKKYSIRNLKIDPDDPDTEILTHVQGDIEFEPAAFNYPTRATIPVFRNLSLTVNAGRSKWIG